MATIIAAMAIGGNTLLDLHCDVFEFSRRYRRDPARRHRPVPWFFTEGHCDLPRMAAAGVDSVVAGVYAPLRRGEAAWRSACRTLAFIAARSGSGPVKVRPALEGAHLLGGRPERVAEVAARGVVAIGLSHLGPNDCARRSGLTALGREVVAACREAGVVIDLAHAHDAVCDEVLSGPAAPVIVSHGGARALHRIRRLTRDDHIAAIAQRGGVVGVMFFPLYLKGRPWGTVDDVLDHVEHICSVGGAGAAAIGSDWDGAVTTPRGLHEPAGLQRLAARLEERGLPLATLGANAARALGWGWDSRPI